MNKKYLDYNNILPDGTYYMLHWQRANDMTSYPKNRKVDVFGESFQSIDNLIIKIEIKDNKPILSEYNDGSKFRLIELKGLGIRRIYMGTTREEVVEIFRKIVEKCISKYEKHITEIRSLLETCK